MLVLAALGLATSATAGGWHRGWDRYCTRTARLQLAGCLAEITDDKFVARAICLNIGDPDEADECRDELRSEHSEGHETCYEQFEARRDLCKDLGEDRYDPSFEPEDFETRFTNLNPYLPLAAGNLWRYSDGEETVTVRVLDETKLIEGVTCIVVNDVVEEEGRLVEDTDDWFAQRSDGTIDYCGEEAKDFEYFEGDEPMEPELVEIEGSFKAGRDGDKSGTLFPGSPRVGMKYRQEWSPSNAEDVAEVLSTRYGYGNDDRFDDLVPSLLVEHLCDDDCVVTADTTPLEPDALEYKFYARGVGFFLEVKPDSEEAVGIVECNVDPKCDDLPEMEEDDDEDD
ncbi:MAG: hypothetical protein ACQGVK_20305 [Myxococcota bacterium]